MWKSLHAAAFYSPGSPPHSASRQHWGQLIWLISPLVSGALPQGNAPHRANRPIEKSPALALECRGFFIHLQLLYQGHFSS